MRYSEGLLIAHACLLVAYVVGASFLSPSRTTPAEATAPQKMVHLVCTCALGFAIAGFAGFLLAIAGLLNLPTAAVSLLACFFAGSLLRRESPFARSYWLDRVRAIGSSWDGQLLAVYYVGLALAFPAMNLINLGDDPVAYHLAYAYEWATTGHLVVDPFLRWAFYANNFVLLDSLLLLAHANVFVMFLVWSTCLLTVLGLFAGVRWILAETIGGLWASLTALFLTAAVVLAPSYIHWLFSAYVDVPIGTFALLATLSIVVGIRERSFGWLMAAAVTSAFLIGMKGSFLPLIAVFGAALWLAARHLKLGRRAIYALLALLVVASSPWYVRNWIAAGDPVWPVLNLALYGHDGLMTQGEETSLSWDLPNARSPQDIATLPYRAFFDVEGNDFRESGTTALILALYVPAAIVFALLLLRGRPPREALVAVLILCMLIGYWAVTSTLLRYALLVVPTLALCLAMTIALPFARWRWRGPIVAALAALTMIPTAGTATYLQQTYLAEYRYLPVSYVSDAEYQSHIEEGYDAVQSVAASLAKLHQGGLLYVVGPRLNYFFLLHGIRVAGDWVGPAGYFRLYAAIDANKAAAFLHDLGVTAVLVGTGGEYIDSMDVPLGQQLTSHGYCVKSVGNARYRLYLPCIRRFFGTH